MNIYDLTINQLKRAVSIREKIEDLSSEFRSILGASGNPMPAQKRKRIMSVSAKKKIAAAQRARWAKLRRAKPARSAKAAKSPAKKAANASANARRSAKLKAYWAAKKKSGRK